MTYLKLNSRITVGSLFFDYVTNVTISKSWQQLTDTATITLPRKLKFKDKKLIDEVGVGDPVLIDLGYSPDLNTEFKGYVTKVKQTVPVKIECEDEMWELKNSSYTQTYDNASISDIRGLIGGSRSIDAVEAKLGPFQISNANGAKILKKLKDDYGLVSWFDNQTLVVGKRYRDNPRTESFDFQENVIENDLEWQKKDDVKIQIVGVSEFSNGNTIKVKVPSDAGDDFNQETRHFFELPESELRNRVNDIVENFRYTGYRGEFTTFGQPFVEHGDEVDLKDQQYPERGGKYFIDAVNVEFGTDGFRRTLKLGKASS